MLGVSYQKISFHSLEDADFTLKILLEMNLRFGRTNDYLKIFRSANNYCLLPIAYCLLPKKQLLKFQRFFGITIHKQGNGVF